MYPYITCLGVDGQLYNINQEAKLLFDEKGLPYAWKLNPLPDVKLIAIVPESNPEKIEQHPLRKALFKYLAAREHKIFEKQRPQDVTIYEAQDMIRAALLESGVHPAEIDKIIDKHYPFLFSC